MRNDQFVDGTFTWFTGVVEDRFDPEEMNRCRVRCFGFHTEDKGILPTEDLPWATVMMPTTSSGTSGVGDSPHGLMEGSWVVGFFRDGPSAQDPIIMGSIASKSSERSKTLGFTSLNFPRGDYIDQSDVNKSGRETTYQTGNSFQEREPGGISFSIKTAVPPKVTTVAPDQADTYYAEKEWNELEPLNDHVPEYPHNKVNESESGHVFEVDDTPGYSRLNKMHSAGTYEEIYNDGTRQVKIVGDDYEVILNNKNIHIKGNMNMTVDGDVRQLVYGNYHLEVEKDYTVNVKGSKQVKIGGNFETEIQRNRSTNIGINDNLTVLNDLNLNITNDALTTIGNDYVINVTNDYSNTSYNDISLFAGGKYSQSSVSDFAVASGGNMKFGTTGNLTEDIDGTHTLTCATAALVYDAGEITVNTITQTAHVHPQPDTTADATTQGDTNSPKANT